MDVVETKHELQTFFQFKLKALRPDHAPGYLTEAQMPAFQMPPPGYEGFEMTARFAFWKL